MLILSRFINQTIVIQDDIHITILSVDGIKVRLGIAAPKSIIVHRKEVHERIKNGIKKLLGKKLY